MLGKLIKSEDNYFTNGFRRANESNLKKNYIATQKTIFTILGKMNVISLLENRKTHEIEKHE